MLALGWFSLGAGLLPGPERIRGRAELVMLSAYGFAGSFAYGTVMNLQGWVILQGMGQGISFHPGDPVGANLARFLAYCLATSLGWDLGRAVLTVVLTMTLGATLLKALRRATRKAAFDAPVSFDSGAESGPGHTPKGIRAPTEREIRASER